jgi:hypothetical protein
MNYELMKTFFFSHLPKSLYLTHYELAKLDPPNNPSSSSIDWREFLTTEDISQFIEQELSLLKQGEFKKLLQNISQTGKSVGIGQTLNALMKSMEVSSIKEGPVFIYTYVPPTPQEQGGSQVKVLEGDIFNADTKTVPD